jgi:hypothetical protein
MQKENVTKFLAIIGTAFVGLPILLTIVAAIIGSIAQGRLVCNYLIPAEMYLDAIAGGLLLLWAALRAKLFRKPVIIGFAGMCVFFALSQGIVFLSGIATGEAAAEGVALTAIIASLAIYTLAMIALTVVGIMMIKKLFAQQNGAE